jgi:hypothetical protein
MSWHEPNFTAVHNPLLFFKNKHHVLLCQVVARKRSLREHCGGGFIPNNPGASEGNMGM